MKREFKDEKEYDEFLEEEFQKRYSRSRDDEQLWIPKSGMIGELIYAVIFMFATTLQFMMGLYIVNLIFVGVLVVLSQMNLKMKGKHLRDFFVAVIGIGILTVLILYSNQQSSWVKFIQFGYIIPFVRMFRKIYYS